MFFHATSSLTCYRNVDVGCLLCAAILLLMHAVHMNTRQALMGLHKGRTRKQFFSVLQPVAQQLAIGFRVQSASQLTTNSFLSARYLCANHPDDPEVQYFSTVACSEWVNISHWVHFIGQGLLSRKNIFGFCLLKMATQHIIVLPHCREVVVWWQGI